MDKMAIFSGIIYFYPKMLRSGKNRKTIRKKLMVYDTPTTPHDFTEHMMSSFQFLPLENKEKKLLSSAHREIINQYRHLNPLLLSDDARRFIESLNGVKEHCLVIEAEGYGAYICLAALYSGHFPFNKKIEFKFASSPLALFPKIMLRANPNVWDVKIDFTVKSDSWLKPFSTLYTNEKILYKLTG